ncbi:TPA: hypothetical protein JG914_004235 [Enterobacter hormaechei subsp. steigerwaltii]|nr:hypothetical protein [Enterobacter hormaechei subsp. steigerwaltii]
MSAKEQFLKKLHSRNPPHGSFNNKAQADIAAFRQAMMQLQDDIGEWLEGTGIELKSFSVSLIELLSSESPFSIHGMSLHYENRVIRFTPVFLYGHGVTGCVEVILVAGGESSVLCRLFMRSTESSDWTYAFVNHSAGQRAAFGEDAFFEVITPLLPV